MNLSQHLLFITVFAASMVATVSAVGNLCHPVVMTDSMIVVTSDADAGDDNNKDDVANRMAAMAALTIFNGVEEQTSCNAKGWRCLDGVCCKGEYDSTFL